MSRWLDPAHSAFLKPVWDEGIGTKGSPEAGGPVKLGGGDCGARREGEEADELLASERLFPLRNEERAVEASDKLVEEFFGFHRDELRDGHRKAAIFMHLANDPEGLCGTSRVGDRLAVTRAGALPYVHKTDVARLEYMLAHGWACDSREVEAPGVCAAARAPSNPMIPVGVGLHGGARECGAGRVKDCAA